MNERYADRISAFMDDELPAGETSGLIEGMENDPQLRDCWGRYQLISDALRNDLPGLVRHDLADRVSLALQSEPAFNLPVSRSARTASSLKPVIGLALAASVAAVTFVLAPWESTTLGPAAGGQGAAPAVASAPVLPGAAVPATVATLSDAEAAAHPAVPATAVADSGGAADGPAPVTQEIGVEPRLYGYLVDHNEFTDTGSVQSTMLPYVRIVGYSANGPQNP